MTTRQVLASLIYTVTIFFSALLLFVIQPMASKLVLPLLGGSSAVWTTSMLFFQILLLAGYIYAHGIAQYFSFRVQVGLHIVVVLAAMLFLPVNVPDTLLRPDQAPALSLVAAFMMGIGPPTFVVSSSAPLLQHWFGGLNHPDADDPYYLYAASNAGSLLALLSYPFLVERFLTLNTQQQAWSIGFLALAVLLGVSGIALFLQSTGSVDGNEDGQTAPTLAYSRRGWWILITFIPSSLMLGVTHYLTMDLASVPLLWVIPLALYLLSFILVFARINHPLWLYRMVLPAAIFILFALSFAKYLPIVWLIVLHTAVFFLVALYFHGRLAQDRPQVTHLTQYYIFMALGGSLGGIFNALIAPLLFDQLVEYVLVMALALICALGWPSSVSQIRRIKNYIPYFLTLLASGYFLFTVPLHVPALSMVAVVLGLVFGVAGLLLLTYRQPATINIVFGGLFCAGFLVHEDQSNTIARERSFYGQYEVQEEPGDVRTFRHGTTLHGEQLLEGGQLLDIPTGYYHPTGPFGDLFRNYSYDRVGIAGLGTGGLAPYKKQGDEFAFFEIDPVVHRMARTHFAFLDVCGSACNVQIGDARRLIRKQPENKYDLLIMDAYTSDAIPTHLLTREAIQLYLSRVREGGVVALHISNRHFNLARVIRGIANDIGAAALVKTFVPSSHLSIPTPLDGYGSAIRPDGSPRFPGTKLIHASSVSLAVIARDEEALDVLPRSDGWSPPSGPPLLWTDNYTNIVPLLTD
jgi:spermidine synthase